MDRFYCLLCCGHTGGGCRGCVLVVKAVAGCRTGCGRLMKWRKSLTKVKEQIEMNHACATDSLHKYLTQWIYEIPKPKVKQKKLYLALTQAKGDMRTQKGRSMGLKEEEME